MYSKIRRERRERKRERMKGKMEAVSVIYYIIMLHKYLSQNLVP